MKWPQRLEKQPDFIRPIEALASPPAANRPGNRGKFIPHGVSLEQWETGAGKELRDKVVVLSVSDRLFWGIVILPSLFQMSCVTKKLAVFLVRLWTALQHALLRSLALHPQCTALCVSLTLPFNKVWAYKLRLDFWFLRLPPRHSVTAFGLDGVWILNIMTECNYSLKFCPVSFRPPKGTGIRRSMLLHRQRPGSHWELSLARPRLAQASGICLPSYSRGEGH